MHSLTTHTISEEVYKKLFDTFYTSLCLFSTKFTNNVEISKDLVQEVFIKIWREQIPLDSNDSAKAFLYTAVRNKSLDFIKTKEFKSKSQWNSALYDIISSEDYFEKQTVIEETARLVDQAISTLPHKCKSIIHLSLKGLENKQISEELSISLNTVKTQKRIAYQKLRPLLKGACACLAIMLIFFITI